MVQRSSVLFVHKSTDFIEIIRSNYGQEELAKTQSIDNIIQMNNLLLLKLKIHQPGAPNE